MTSKQFIANNVGYEHGKEKFCASVFVDRHGVVYSYGYHYPLAWIIDGVGFVNNRGYSITTSKHIGWAFSALAERLGWGNVHGVELPRDAGNVNNIDTLRTALEATKAKIKAEMDAKKRKDTWVFQDLERQLSKNQEALDVLKTLHGETGTDRGESDFTKTVATVARLGDIFTDNQADANDWKARMLAAGFGEALHMPEDWGELSEDEKQRRLNGAIDQLDN